MEIKATSRFAGKYTNVEVSVDGTTIDLGMMGVVELIEFVKSLVESAYQLLPGDGHESNERFSRIMDEIGIEYIESGASDE